MEGLCVYFKCLIFCGLIWSFVKSDFENVANPLEFWFVFEKSFFDLCFDNFGVWILSCNC